MKLPAIFIGLLYAQVTSQQAENLQKRFFSEPERQQIKMAVDKSCADPTTRETCLTLLADFAMVDINGNAAVAKFLIDVIEPRLADLKNWIPGTKGLSQLENNLGLAYLEQQRGEKAMPLFLDTLEFVKRSDGPESLDAAQIMRNLGNACRDTGNVSEAISWLEQSVAILRAKLGGGKPDTLESVLNLGMAYDQVAWFEKSEPLFEEAVRGWRAIGENADTGRVLNVYGSHFMQRSRFEKGEAPLLEGLRIRRKVLPPGSSEITTSLNNLASVYMNLGQFEKASPYFLEGLEIRRQILGAKHASTATILNNLCSLYIRQNRFAEAEPYCTEALEIRRQTPGNDHSLTATTMQNLANLYLNLDKKDEAGRLYAEGDAVLRKNSPPGHPDVLRTANNVGGFQISVGHYAKAIEIVDAALMTVRPATTSTAPAISLRLTAGQARAADNRFAEAAPYYRDVLDLQTEYVRVLLPTLPERPQKEFLSTLAAQRDLILTHALSLGPDPASKALGADVNRLFKGLRLSTQQEFMSLLRREGGPQALDLLDSTLSLRQRLSALEGRGAKKETLGPIRAELEASERKLLSISGYRQSKQAIRSEDVQRELPQHGAFVDLAYFRKRDPKILPWKSDGPWHYGAVVYTHQGITAVDIGPAVPIHSNLNRLLAMDERLWKGGSLASQAEIEADLAAVRTISRDLNDQLLNPIRRALGDAAFRGIHHWILSPDGELGYLPWEMLVDESKRFWIESTLISYAESPRSFVQGNRKDRPSQRPALAVLNPQYDLQMTMTPQKKTPQLAGTDDIRPLYQGNLAKRFEEANSGAKTLQWDKADESALRTWISPANLLIWTHGKLFEKASDPLDKIRILLRGAGSGNGQAGLVTARQIMNLDLTGTRLAVIAGCNTGYGSVEAGEGLLGMRRALWVAGAHSQLLTLWPVSDLHTVTWLELFYQELRRPGMSLAQASANVHRLFIAGRAPQLNSSQRHPYFWAPFTLSGDWQK